MPEKEKKVDLWRDDGEEEETKKEWKKPNQRDNLIVENAWKQNWKEMDLNERGVKPDHLIPKTLKAGRVDRKTS